MFVHNINPTLIELGPIEIRWYGIVWALGFYLVYRALDKNIKEWDITKKKLDNFFLYLILATVLGARLFHIVFWNPSYLLNPLDLIAVWKGGLAFHGGLVGALLACIYFCKTNKISINKFANAVILPAVFALALGRIANFINGEIWGTITNLPWCVEFPYAEGCRHPVQLYEAGTRFLAFFALWKLSTLKKNLLPFFLIFMGFSRFLVDFFKDDLTHLFLTTGQWLALIMVILGCALRFRHSAVATER